MPLLRICIVLMGLVLFTIVSAHARPTRTLRRAEYIMGTMLTITINGLETDAAKVALASAFGEVHRLDSILSNYKPSSEISRVGYSKASPLRVSPDTFEFLELSAHYSELSRGNFDITAAQGVQANFRSVVLGEDRHVYIAEPALRIDPGAIGKGYAVDKVVALLRSHGVRSALVDFGKSSFFALGRNERGQAWSLASDTKHPISLADQALSFSSAETIVDPSSGAVISESRNAWVVADTATAADALSTALVVRPTLLEKDELRAAWQKACVMREKGNPHCN